MRGGETAPVVEVFGLVCEQEAPLGTCEQIGRRPVTDHYFIFVDNRINAVEDSLQRFVHDFQLELQDVRLFSNTFFCTPPWSESARVAERLNRARLAAAAGL